MERLVRRFGQDVVRHRTAVDEDRGACTALPPRRAGGRVERRGAAVRRAPLEIVWLEVDIFPINVEFTPTDR